jgi:hypothetical protein
VVITTYILIEAYYNDLMKSITTVKERLS